MEHKHNNQKMTNKSKSMDHSNGKYIKKDSDSVKSNYVKKDSDNSKSKYVKKDSDNSKSKYVKKDSDNLKSKYVKKDSDNLKSKYVKKDSDNSKSKYVKKDLDNSKSKYVKKDSDNLKSKYVRKSLDDSKENYVKKGSQNIRNQKYLEEPIAEDKVVRKLKSKCSVSNRCHRCQYIDVDYQVQVVNKNKQVRIALDSFAKVDPMIEMEKPLHYRNKMQVVFHRRKDGEIETGIREDSNFQIIPIKKCYLENEKAEEIAASVAKLMKSFKISIYSENSGYGIMRHILVRIAETTGQILVVLVTNTPIFPSKNNFVKALLKLHPEITTIVQNINEKNTSVVLGYRDNVMFGKGYIEEAIEDQIFCVTPKSLFSVNSKQMEKKFQLLKEHTDISQRDVVVDLSCGIGMNSIIVAKDAKEIIAVDANHEAVKEAKINAKNNQLKNIAFYSNESDVFLKEFLTHGKKVDFVFYMPERNGYETDLLESLLEIAPENIIAIASNVESVARDLKKLVKGNTKKGFKYQVSKIASIDMAPMTGYYEVIVFLQKEKK